MCSILSLNYPVSVVSLNVYGTEWTCRTKVLASAASYAAFGIDHRNPESFLSSLFQWYHLYGTSGAMALAVATRLTVAHRDAVLSDPYRMTNLYGRFLLTCNGTYGTSGTDVGTPCTLGTAIAALVGHFRLHETRKVR